MGGVLRRRGKRAHREGHAIRGPGWRLERGTCKLQSTEEHPGPQQKLGEAGRSRPGAFEGAPPSLTRDFRLLVSKAVRQKKSVVLATQFEIFCNSSFEKLIWGPRHCALSRTRNGDIVQEYAVEGPVCAHRPEGHRITQATHRSGDPTHIFFHHVKPFPTPLVLSLI